MRENELAPCPFCSGAASLGLCGFGTARVVCMDCGSEGTYSPTREDAITAWNRRSAASLAAGKGEAETAIARFNACGGAEEPDPLERLRFFCSLAMNGQDWLDVEPFFDALKAKEPNVHLALSTVEGTEGVEHDTDVASSVEGLDGGRQR